MRYAWPAGVSAQDVIAGLKADLDAVTAERDALLEHTRADTVDTDQLRRVIAEQLGVRE